MARDVIDRLLSAEEARQRILKVVDPLPADRIEAVEALGRVVAEPVMATTDLPPWDNSAMDGYAIRAADVSAATNDAPMRLQIVGEAPAGRAPTATVEPGTAVRIATGAPLPEGADAVVPVEETSPLDASGSPIGGRGRDASGPLPVACAVHRAVPVGNAIRPRGEDIRAGATLLDPGDELTPGAISLAAGAGVRFVNVHRRQRVAVLATGDEIWPAGEGLGAFGIPDANGPGLRALVAAEGAATLDLGIAPDELSIVVERLRRGVDEADAVIVSGGVSVGPYDVVRAGFQAVGEVDLWRVAVQPGKPFAFGTARGPHGRVLLFGLPGNPASSFVTFELFVRPALRRLAGHRRVVRPIDRGLLMDRASKASGRRAFLRVRAERAADGSPVRDEAGRVRLRLSGGQGSHMLSGLATAEALAIIPEDVDSVSAGSPVDVWWLDRP